MSNIMQAVRGQKSLTTLNTGLDNVLLAKGPFTLFAPTNIAFKKLERSTVEDLLRSKNKTELREILNQHIVAGNLNYKDLKDGEKLKSISGKELSINVKNGQVSINGANVDNHDLNASNGIIHSLDSVLLQD